MALVSPLRAVAVAALLVTGCQAEKRPSPAHPVADAGDVAAAKDTRAAPDTPAPDGRTPEQDAATTDARPAAACVEMPVRRPAASNVVEIDVELTLDGQPVVFGEKNVRPNGETLTPSNVRLYLSEPALVHAAGETAVDIVGADGAPVPYNVHLVNAETAAGMKLRIAAPDTQYTAMTFLFGLLDRCNAGDPSTRKPPLTHTSQMTWPHTAGYLFLRYEEQGRHDATIHMGGQIGMETAPRVTARGSFSVAAGQPTKVKLRVALDQILAGSKMEADFSNLMENPLFTLKEIQAGERLRQNATKLPIFTLAR